MTLFEMTEAAKKLYFYFDDGDIDEATLQDALNDIGAEEKLEAYVNVQKTLEAELAAHETEKKRHESRIKTISNRIEKLKTAQIEYMRAAKIEKARAGTFELSLRKSKAVEILDASAIPKEYILPQPPKIDKASIGKALKNGETIPGAALVENESIVAR